MTEDTPDPSIMHIHLNVRGRNRKKLNAPRRIPEGLTFENDGIGADDCVLLPMVSTFDDVGTRRSSSYSPHVPYSPTNTGSSPVNYRKQRTAPVVIARARPFSTGIVLKERVIAATMDPLYLGTTAMDQAAVNMNLSAKQNKQSWGSSNDYCC